MFTVNEKTPENTLQYFSINRLQDFVQKDVRVTNIEVVDGNFGKQLKITVGKDEAEAYTWVAQEPGEDKTLPNGKILTKEQQIKGVQKVIAHIGRKFLEEPFSINGTTFEEVCNDLIAQTKDKWATTPLRAKFILKNGYANLSSYVPFLENMEVPDKESQLRITEKDAIAFNELTNTSADVEEEDSTESDF